VLPSSGTQCRVIAINKHFFGKQTFRQGKKTAEPPEEAVFIDTASGSTAIHDASVGFRRNRSLFWQFGNGRKIPLPSGSYRPRSN
jgi:predicted ATP-binding protein involved in virulence